MKPISSDRPYVNSQEDVQLALFETGVPIVSEVAPTHEGPDDTDPRAIRYRYPESLSSLNEARISRRLGFQASRSRAHQENGGGVYDESDDVWYDKYIRYVHETSLFVPLDVIQGFERMNISKLMGADPDNVHPSQFKRLTLHFNAYIEQLENVNKNMSTEDSYLGDRFSMYGIVSQKQAYEYATTLADLRGDLLSSRMGQVLYNNSPKPHGSQSLNRRAAANDIKRHDGRLPYIVWDTKTSSPIVHYEVEKERKRTA